MKPSLDAHARAYLQDAVIDNGVAIVTSAHAGRVNAMTVSFFAESSHLPVLCRVAISPKTLTHELVEASGWFGLSVLGRGQEALALGCGTRSGRSGCKFDALGLAHRPGPHGVPLLPGCITTSECRVVERIDLGDHTLFVGEMLTSLRQTRASHLEVLLLSNLRDYVGP